MVIQQIIHRNPANPSEFHSKIVKRKTPHTIETLMAYAKQYGQANMTSINGRTKLGWRPEIITIG
jgi:hypothetical protein